MSAATEIIDAPSDEPGVPDEAAIATRTTVRELVATFQAAELQIRAAFGTIVAAEKRLNEVFALASERHEMAVNPSREPHHYADFGDADRAIERLARQAWQAIVDRLDVRRVLSAARAKELDDRLEKGKLPAITEENVIAFARELQDVRGFFEEKVAEVFDWIRPRAESWRMRNYKTNQKNARYELGERVVLTGIVKPSTFGRNQRGGRFEVDYDDRARLIALEAVFSALDGRGWGAQAHRSALEDAIESAPEGHGSTAYFEFRAFKNRSLHIRIVRLDLLARFNAIAAGKTLRPGRDAA